LDNFLATLRRLTLLLPERKRDPPNSPFVFAVDHCFNVRGQGTVMTGTVLQGEVKVADVSFPVSRLNEFMLLRFNNYW